MMEPLWACSIEDAKCCWYEEGSDDNECNQGEVAQYAVNATQAEHV